MPVKKKNLRLVIDADVLSGATEMQHPDSSNCRKFLESVRDNQHILVLTDKIIEEYKNNESKYSRRWRKDMYQKGLFEVFKINDNEKIERKLYKFDLIGDQKKTTVSEKDYKLMLEKRKERALKDCHLIDAALKTDKIIASNDDKARDVFSIAAVKAKALRTLFWVNPKKIAAELIIWLEGKRKIQKEWFLISGDIHTDL